MFSLTIAYLKRRGARLMLLLFGAVMVSAAFGLLASTASTVVVTIDQDMARYWRTSYDILVRPRNAVSPTEYRYGMVQGDYLSGIHGGISVAQYRAIESIPGVEVAAPVAMIGFFDLRIPAQPWFWGDPKASIRQPGFYAEKITITTDDGLRKHSTKFWRFYYVSFGDERLTAEDVQALSERGVRVMQFHRKPPNPVLAGGTYSLPVLLAAVDPKQESRLVGLDKAVTWGRYFGVGDKVHRATSIVSGTNEALTSFVFPILLNGRSYVHAEIRRELWRGKDPPGRDALEAILSAGDLRDVPKTLQSDDTISNEEVYHLLPRSWSSVGFGLWSPGGESGYTFLPSLPGYREIGALPNAPTPVLEAIPRGISPCLPGSDGCSPHIAFKELTSRRVEGVKGILSVRGELKGAFDIEKLSLSQGTLNYLPLETYYPPLLTLRYDESGSEIDPPVTLYPTFDPEGYAQRPPLALTTIEAAELFDSKYPISAIRVRVGGIDRYSPEAQRRIEAIASEIVERTGLHVDVVTGSSPRKVLVHIPGHSPVPPVGYVEEMWVQKGVSLTIARKTRVERLLLFSAMLLIFSVYMFDTSLMDVLSRKEYLALQKALGWRSGTIFSHVLAEALLVGVVAGVTGMALAALLAFSFGLTIPLRIILSIPMVGVAACGVGGVIPAWMASRVPPAEMMVHRASPARAFAVGRVSVLVYAVRGMFRRWERTLLLALIVAFSTALGVLFLEATLHTKGYLRGTLLGDYILLHVEWYHYAMVAVSFVVAALAMADAAVVEIAERRREIGVLKAVGWRDGDVSRLFLSEGVILGAMGGSLGTVLGLLTFALSYGAAPGALVPVSLAGIAAPTVVSLLAILYPAKVAAGVPPAEPVRYE